MVGKIHKKYMLSIWRVYSNQSLLVNTKLYLEEGNLFTNQILKLIKVNNVIAFLDFITILGRKVMTNLDTILKSRDINLSTKVHLVKAMVYPVVMYGCESWTVKKAECRSIDVFELWCWRRLLRVPWTARRSKPVYPKGDQSRILIGRTDAEAEAPILWPPDAKSQLIGKNLDAGED